MPFKMPSDHKALISTKTVQPNSPQSNTESRGFKFAQEESDTILENILISVSSQSLFLHFGGTGNHYLFKIKGTKLFRKGLIGYILFNVPLVYGDTIKGLQHLGLCMLCGFGRWAGRDLYRAGLVVTRDLCLSCLWRTVPVQSSFTTSMRY